MHRSDSKNVDDIIDGSKKKNFQYKLYIIVFRNVMFNNFLMWINFKFHITIYTKYICL